MSEPPHASSWAAPPEFYLDENLAGKTLRRFLQNLGYTVHTPAELFGSRSAAEGVDDEIWLRLIGDRGWIVIGRDTRILERPSELDAYRAARVHMFLFPGNATRSELVETANDTLVQICTKASEATPQVWRVRGGTRPHVEVIDIVKRQHRAP